MRTTIELSLQEINNITSALGDKMKRTTGDYYYTLDELFNKLIKVEKKLESRLKSKKKKETNVL